jgi:hypothetical protein
VVLVVALAPDTKDIKALGTALKLAAKFEAVDRLARDWIEENWREKKPAELDESDRRKWYDLRDGWERAIKALKNSVDKFRVETGFSPILGYRREVEKAGILGKVFLGYDSVEAKGFRIVYLYYPAWFEELGLPTEEMSEDAIYKLVPTQRMSDEQERTLRESFIEDLRETGIDRFLPFMRRYELTIDKLRTYNENVLRVDALVQTIKREHALALVKPPGPIVPMTTPREAPEVPGEAPKPSEVPSEVKVKVRVEEGMNPGEYFVHLLYNGFEADFSGILSTQALKEYLDQKEDYVDFRENLSLQGLSEQQVEEELKKLPAPFSSGEEVKVVWTDADVEFSPKAREWWDAFSKVYTRGELEAFDWERLKTIAKLKGVRVGKDKAETVASILGEAVPPVTVAPPTAPVRPVEKRGLTSGDISKLQDVYSDRLFRELGRVPPNSMATFRVEIEKVKDKTFSEAEDHILGIANDIIGSFVAREGVRVIPSERRVEAMPRLPELGVPTGRVPPAQFPSYPLCYNMPFPRGPCSEEKLKLWQVFCYQMQESEYDCMTYQTEFDAYIGGTQFLSWEDLRAKFNVFVETIMKGLSLPPLFTWQGAPIPTGLRGEIQERLPLERLEDLVTHYSSVVIRNARSKGDIPTLEDLKDELVEHGVIPESTSISELRDMTKTALTHALDRKDLWVSGRSTPEINDFLASSQA